MRTSFPTLLFIISFCSAAFCQDSQDAATIKMIFDQELTTGKSYEMLESLTTKIGGRLSGSPSAARAVEWGRDQMQNSGYDSVWLQPVMVPHWVRGQKEMGKIIKGKNNGTINLNICALGTSIGTGPSGVTGNVVEVKSFDELKQLGKKEIQGKIVFFNHPMDPTLFKTFEAYGAAVTYRVTGAAEASKLGAVAVIVRSMGSNIDDNPHTGVMRYEDGVTKIPAVAVSTRHAELLSSLIKEDKKLKIYIETHCEMLEDAPSFNVVGEIKGSEYPDEIIVVGGHLDSWDLAQGAHDDGTGCVQSIEVLRLFKQMGYKPKRTLRAVLFMNEENGTRGGAEYARLARTNKEKHIAAIESDEGGFTPRGFSMTADENVKAKIKSWKPLLEKYGLTDFDTEGGGADIEEMLDQGVPMFGFMPDSQRYFSYHHTTEDTFDKVNKRELELGAASMTALVYLIDKYGLK